MYRFVRLLDITIVTIEPDNFDSFHIPIQIINSILKYGFKIFINYSFYCYII